MAGTPPKTAQSPNATRILQRLRIRCATSSLAVLLTPPSRMPTSTPPASGSLRSVIGVARISTNSASWTMRSSMSRKDMWHPAQPAIQSVETLGLVIVSPLCFRQRHHWHALEEFFFPLAHPSVAKPLPPFLHPVPIPADFFRCMDRFVRDL